jgi:UTP--glucose-1-phosphate uridylyltransferase
MRVRKAVFPAAGWGTRFLPATKAQPKEMLPLVDKPVIQYAVEEAVAAGIEQSSSSPPARSARSRTTSTSAMSSSTCSRRRATSRCSAGSAHQRPGPDGLRPPEGAAWPGPRGADGQGAHRPRAVRGDPARRRRGRRPAVHRPADPRLQQTHGSVVAVMEVPPRRPAATASSIRAGRQRRRTTAACSGSRAWSRSPIRPMLPSNLAIIGRYVLTPKIFEKLEQTQRGAGGEIQLTDAIEDADGRSRASSPTPSRARRYDAGTTMGWLKASVELALQRPDLSAANSGTTSGTCPSRKRPSSRGTCPAGVPPWGTMPAGRRPCAPRDT